MLRLLRMSKLWTYSSFKFALFGRLEAFSEHFVLLLFPLEHVVCEKQSMVHKFWTVKRNVLPKIQILNMIGIQMEILFDNFKFIFESL